MAAAGTTAGDTSTFQTGPVLQGALVAWHDLFSTLELKRLAEHCDALVLEQAGLAGSEQQNRIRRTQVAWVARDVATEAIYRRMEEVVLTLNARYFRFDLSQLVTFQYAVYDGGGHFDWHKDYGRAYGAPGQEPRKLTLSLQLSDPADYDGCCLEVRGGNEIDVAPRERGSLTAFPANVLHRVTPLTRGVRKSLVIWAAGPEFR
jgi:PKHD-type hydroxylase